MHLPVRFPTRTAVLAAAATAVLALPLVAVQAASAAPPATRSAPSTAAAPAGTAALPPPVVKGAACHDKTGVTVVVDFRDLVDKDGQTMNLIRIGCAEGAQQSGLTALLGAGFKVDPDQTFVCTINDRPLHNKSCPPPDGFWSYSHGLRGDRWTLSSVGAGDWTPPPGSLEGWSWSPYGHQPASWDFPRVSPKDLFPMATPGLPHRSAG